MLNPDTSPFLVPEARTDFNDTVRDVVRIMNGKEEMTPEQRVAVLLVSTVPILNGLLTLQPGRRGKLINTMAAEYRRVLQRQLRNG